MPETDPITAQESVDASAEPIEQPEVGDLKRTASNDDKADFKRQKVPVPEGMTKRQWKRILKQQRWEETKDEYNQKKREKKKAARQRRRERIQEAEANGESTEELLNYHQLRRSKILPNEQIETDIRIVMDCEFDELMNEKEIVSLSNQITRSYSAKKHCKYNLQLDISSFNKTLKSRFEKSVPQYDRWTNINFVENDRLQEILPMDDPQKLSQCVYLTADTDQVIDTLEPHHTYIIGGIVDKNRHKNLCVNKAQELGLRVGRLPIDKFIQMNGRQVLATSHVFELCCKWFESDKDWGKAFNEVLPPRKVKGKAAPAAVPATGTAEPAEPADALPARSPDASSASEASPARNDELS